MVCAATCVSAQETAQAPAPDDTRTQYPRVHEGLVLLAEDRLDRLSLHRDAARAGLHGRVDRQAASGRSPRFLRPSLREAPVGAGHLHAPGAVRRIQQRQRDQGQQRGLERVRGVDAGHRLGAELAGVDVSRRRIRGHEPIGIPDRGTDRAAARALRRRPGWRRTVVPHDADDRLRARRHLLAGTAVVQPAVHAHVHRGHSVQHARAAGGDGSPPTRTPAFCFPKTSCASAIPPTRSRTA